MAKIDLSPLWGRFKGKPKENQRETKAKPHVFGGSVRRQAQIVGLGLRGTVEIQIKSYSFESNNASICLAMSVEST